MTKAITKPTQAASPRTVDRWQLALAAIEGAVRSGRTADALMLIASLQKSLRRAERR